MSKHVPMAVTYRYRILGHRGCVYLPKPAAMCRRPNLMSEKKKRTMRYSEIKLKQCKNFIFYFIF